MDALVCLFNESRMEGNWDSARQDRFQRFYELVNRSFDSLQAQAWRVNDGSLFDYLWGHLVALKELLHRLMNGLVEHLSIPKYARWRELFRRPEDATVH